MNLSEKISIIRKARKYTQEEMGNKIGVSRQTVSDWEKGKFEPTLDSIRAIAEVLNVSYDTLLNEKVDLNDKVQLNVALKNLDNETKGKVNNSFRYRIREYTITKKDYIKVILHFVLIAVFSIATIICSLITNDIDGMFFIDLTLGTIALCFLSTLAIPINDIKRIRAGGYNYSFGTLSQTHLVIIGWSDSKFDRTVYIPVSEIESMELNKDATSRHGTVVVKIKGRNKPLITNDIVEPQKLIDIFNNLETIIESPYGK